MLNRHLPVLAMFSALIVGSAVAGSPLDPAFVPEDPAAPAFSPSMPPIANTGFVLVNGFGYDRGHMLFCEPKYGHVVNRDQLTVYKVVDHQCLPGGWIAPGTEGYVRAIPAQAYLDELIGKGVVEFVGVAPAWTNQDGLLAVLYYRAKYPAGQPVSE